jgi:hypothetical protein
LDQQKTVSEKLREIRQAIKQLRQRRPLAERELVMNWAEAAQVLGVSRMSIWRYRQATLAPQLPSFKTAVRRWAQTYGLPRKRGPRASPIH